MLDRTPGAGTGRVGSRGGSPPGAVIIAIEEAENALVAYRHAQLRSRRRSTLYAQVALHCKHSPFLEKGR